MRHLISVLSLAMASQIALIGCDKDPQLNGEGKVRTNHLSKSKNSDVNRHIDISSVSLAEREQLWLAAAIAEAESELTLDAAQDLLRALINEQGATDFDAFVGILAGTETSQNNEYGYPSDLRLLQGTSWECGETVVNGQVFVWCPMKQPPTEGQGEEPSCDGQELTNEEPIVLVLSPQDIEAGKAAKLQKHQASQQQQDAVTNTASPATALLLLTDHPVCQAKKVPLWCTTAFSGQQQEKRQGTANSNQCANSAPEPQPDQDESETTMPEVSSTSTPTATETGGTGGTGSGSTGSNSGWADCSDPDRIPEHSRPTAC